MGIILARQTKIAFNYLFLVCAFGGFLGFLSTVILDRAIFGVWAIPVLGNLHFNVIEGKTKRSACLIPNIDECFLHCT